MSIDEITWADIDTANGQPGYTCQPTRCAACRQSIIRRLPDRTYYRSRKEAATGRRPLSACPRCGRALQPHNRAN